jgi:hypothetical protein
MITKRLLMLPIACSLGVFCAVSALAQEVYRWVDENGVVNFSDTAPQAAESSANVNTVILEDTTPKDYDPEADIYNVAAQAERMQALRDQMEKDREARLEQQRSAPQQPAVQYQTGVNYGYPYSFPAYGRPPYRPPARPPSRPVPEPYETSTLRPPGQIPNPQRK